MKQLFIKTSDEGTKNELLKSGFKIISYSSGIYTFANNGKLVFSGDDKKIIYTNKIEM